MMSQTLRLSDGLTAHALVAGEGPPLVLIHGVGMCAQTWAAQVAILAAHHRVIAVDMPGHGQSDPLPLNANLSDFVTWAAQVIAALGVGPVNLAGHSMGALMTIGTAIEYPQLVLRAAALNAVYQRTPDARAAVRARAAEIAANIGGIDGPLDRWFTPAQETLRDQVAGWLRAVSHRGYATAYSAFADGDTVYAGRMHLIRCPLLVLTGEGDANSTPAMTETMAGQAPHARAVVIAGHRHMVTLTAPEAVNEALLTWLTTQETAA